MSQTRHDPAFSTIEVPGAEPPALRVSPPGGSAGRIIVLPGIHGRTPHILQVCQRLAANGMESVVADFYCDAARRGEIRSSADVGPAVAALDDAAIAATVVNLAASLRGTGRVGVLGYCVGGTIALLAAAASETVTPTVAYYGVLRNRGALATKGADPIDALAAVTAPVLAHYGTTDGWCPPQDVDELEATLQSAGSAHSVYRYPGAGHAFEEHRSAGFRPVAAAEAAHRTLLFFDHYVAA